MNESASIAIAKLSIPIDGSEKAWSDHANSRPSSPSSNGILTPAEKSSIESPQASGSNVTIENSPSK